MCCGAAAANPQTAALQHVIHLEPQEEQLLEEQLPQEEPAVLLKFPPTENAQADIKRVTFLLLHLGHSMVSEDLKTSFSNWCSHLLQLYS